MSKRQPKSKLVVTTYKLKRDDDIENVIRLAVKCQARLRKEGIELSWNMSYRPCEPEKS